MHQQMIVCTFFVKALHIIGDDGATCNKSVALSSSSSSMDSPKIFLLDFAKNQSKKYALSKVMLLLVIEPECLNWNGRPTSLLLCFQERQFQYDKVIKFEVSARNWGGIFSE